MKAKHPMFALHLIIRTAHFGRCQAMTFRSEEKVSSSSAEGTFYPPLAPLANQVISWIQGEANEFFSESPGIISHASSEWMQQD